MSKLKEQLIHVIQLPVDLSPANVIEFNVQLKHCLNIGTNEIKIDCSSILQISSSHIGLLWQAFFDCRQAGVALLLDSASDGLKRVLVTLDVAEIFGIDERTIERYQQNQFETFKIQASQQYDDRINVSKLGTEAFLLRFSSFLKTLGISQNAAYEIRTVLYEILTNICNYSGLEESANIEFTAHTDSQGIALTIRDKGISFDPTKFKRTTDFASAAQKRQHRGFGLVMVNKMVNEIQYSRTNNGYNLLTLVKRWGK